MKNPKKGTKQGADERKLQRSYAMEWERVNKWEVTPTSSASEGDTTCVVSPLDETMFSFMRCRCLKPHRKGAL